MRISLTVNTNVMGSFHTSIMISINNINQHPLNLIILIKNSFIPFRDIRVNHNFFFFFFKQICNNKFNFTGISSLLCIYAVNDNELFILTPRCHLRSMNRIQMENISENLSNLFNLMI